MTLEFSRTRPERGKLGDMRLVIVALLVLTGCSGDDGGGETGAATSTGSASSGSPTTSGEDGTTDSDDDDDDDDDSAGVTTDGGEDTGPGSSGSDEAGDSTGEDGGDSTDEGGNACDPDAQPNECLTCVATNCCNALSLCGGSAACECIIECHVVKGNSIGNCKSTCDADDAAVEAYNGVYFCGQMSCLGTCDWNVG